MRADTDGWYVEILGGVRATRGDRAVTRFSSRKTAGVLGRLAFRVGAALPREELAELAWPRLSRTAALARLSRSLSSLRRQLEPPGVAPGTVIVSDRSSVGLASGAVATDLQEFQAELARARSETARDRVAHLERAIGLYRGELLSGFEDAWLASERSRLREHLASAARDAARAHVLRRDTDRAVEHLRTAAVASPLDESIHRDLMSLLAEIGRPLEAVRHYERLARTLKSEVSRLPSPETRALARSLDAREARPARATAVPADASPPASGTLTFLVLEPATDEVRAAVASQGEVLACDERLAARFGRASAALAAALDAQRRATRNASGVPALRVALDTGEVDAGAPGSRAIERAEAILRVARDGHILCSEPTAALLGTVERRLTDLGELHLPGREGAVRIFSARPRDATWPEAAPAATRATGSILPLDLSRFFGREEELRLLGRDLVPSGDVRLLTVTGMGGMGKTRLAVEAARRLSTELRGPVWFVSLQDVRREDLLPAVAEALRLPPSSRGELVRRIAEAAARGPSLLVLDNLEHLVPEATPFLGELLERASELRCLVTSRRRLGIRGERVLALEPLALPDDAADAATLASLPSVRLFVDRAQAVRPDFQVTPRSARPLAELVRRLEGVPLALELAAARAGALSIEEMLARLSKRLDAFASRRGSSRHRTLRAAIAWSHELLTAEQARTLARLAVFPGSFTTIDACHVCETDLDRLEELEASSLVRRAPGCPELRFTLLEIVRAFAAERLDPDERASLDERHARRFLEVARREEGELSPERSRRIGAELESFRAALDWSEEEPARAGLGLELCARLWRFLDLRGLTDEGLRRCAAALGPKRAPTLDRVETHLAASTFAIRKMDLAACRSHAEEALAGAEELGDEPHAARALDRLANVAFFSGDVAEARSRHAEAEERSSRGGGAALVAVIRYNRAYLELARGDFRSARAILERCLGADVPLVTRAEIRWAFGHVLVALGEPQAREHLDEALAIFGELDHPRGVAASVRALAWLEERTGDLDGARRRLEAGLARSRARGETADEQALWLLDLTRVAPGEVARASLDQVRRLAAEVTPDVARAIPILRANQARSRDPELARSLYREALASFDPSTYDLSAIEALEGLAAVERARGAHERTARLLGHVDAARDAFGPVRSPVEAASYARVVASLERALGAAAFEEAWRSGRALTFGEALAFATSPRA
jgi:predicted ATPase/DNA-binding SARP family transcriptional activator